MVVCVGFFSQDVCPRSYSVLKECSFLTVLRVIIPANQNKNIDTKEPANSCHKLSDTISGKSYYEAILYLTEKTF